MQERAFFLISLEVMKQVASLEREKSKKDSLVTEIVIFAVQIAELAVKNSLAFKWTGKATYNKQFKPWRTSTQNCECCRNICQSWDTIASSPWTVLQTRLSEQLIFISYGFVFFSYWRNSLQHSKHEKWFNGILYHTRRCVVIWWGVLKKQRRFNKGHKRWAVWSGNTRGARNQLCLHPPR